MSGLLGRAMRRDLDDHITGHGGEDYFRTEEPDASESEVVAALEQQVADLTSRLDVLRHDMALHGYDPDAPVCRNCGNLVHANKTAVGDYRGTRMHLSCALTLRVADLESQRAPSPLPTPSTRTVSTWQRPQINHEDPL